MFEFIKKWWRAQQVPSDAPAAAPYKIEPPKAEASKARAEAVAEATTPKAKKPQKPRKPRTNLVKPRN